MALPKIQLIIMISWWYTYPSEKYDFVSWDDEIPNIWEKNVPKHQPVVMISYENCHSARHTLF